MHPMIHATSDLARLAAARVEQTRVTPDEAARGACGSQFWFLATRVARQLSANNGGCNGAPSPNPLNKTAELPCTT